MKITVVAYGIAKDIVGSSQLELETEDGSTVSATLELIKEKFPAFKELTSILLAVNEEYAEDDHIIQAGDELVLIPPVSGG